jgi:hypothetical protein
MNQGGRAPNLAIIGNTAPKSGRKTRRTKRSQFRVFFNENNDSLSSLYSQFFTRPPIEQKYFIGIGSQLIKGSFQQGIAIHAMAGRHF